MLVEIQCLARPTGTPENPYAHVEAAINVIQDSGLRYEVDALGTTIEGEPAAVWPLLQRIHEATLIAGAQTCVSVIKVAQSAPGSPQSTIDSLTGKFRGGSQ